MARLVAVYGYTHGGIKHSTFFVEVEVSLPEAATTRVKLRALMDAADAEAGRVGSRLGEDMDRRIEEGRDGLHG